MTLSVPDELQLSDRFTAAELLAELALSLFRQDRLTLAQAARLAGVPHLEFQRLLRSRDIPLHYDLQDLDEDLNRVEQIAGS